MANTISNITYSNTFGEWVIVTNALVNDHNQFARFDYTKDLGTLFLADPTLSLQAIDAIFTGNVRIQGTGSSLYVQNDLTIGGNINIINGGITSNGNPGILGQVYTSNGPGIPPDWKNIVSGATLFDTSFLNANLYIGMSQNTSGAWLEAYVSSSKLYFNPATGILYTPQVQANNVTDSRGRSLQIRDANNNIIWGQ